ARARARQGAGDLARRARGRAVPTVRTDPVRITAPRGRPAPGSLRAPAAARAPAAHRRAEAAAASRDRTESALGARAHGRDPRAAPAHVVGALLVRGGNREDPGPVGGDPAGAAPPRAPPPAPRPPRPPPP